jgi:hypothetical protein
MNLDMNTLMNLMSAMNGGGKGKTPDSVAEAMSAMGKGNGGANGGIMPLLMNMLGSGGAGSGANPLFQNLFGKAKNTASQQQNESESEWMPPINSARDYNDSSYYKNNRFYDGAEAAGYESISRFAAQNGIGRTDNANAQAGKQQNVNASGHGNLEYENYNGQEDFDNRNAYGNNKKSRSSPFNNISEILPTLMNMFSKQSVGTMANQNSKQQNNADNSGMQNDGSSSSADKTREKPSNGQKKDIENEKYPNKTQFAEESAKNPQFFSDKTAWAVPRQNTKNSLDPINFAGFEVQSALRLLKNHNRNLR